MAFITDPARAIDSLCAWLHSQLEKTGRSEFVLGLSGGLDSAVAAYLAVQAVGHDALQCIIMPYRTSSPQSLADAKLVADTLGVRHRVVDISAMADGFEAQVTDLTPLRRGNLCARLRMMILFDQAHARGLVLGTSNKTEILLGYGTLHGDAAWSLNPLGDLYKTDVRFIARHIGVPVQIIEKIPTADLWDGQTDEGELGFLYADMDRVLVKIVDEKKSRREVLAEGANPKLVERVVSLIRGSAFKRRSAPVAWLAQPYSTAPIEDPQW
ncbi:NAD+ synthase [candidate division KSB1 bacterium]|nr:MAG: NAD+ synthase [candidate division KSB1 bacterium]